MALRGSLGPPPALIGPAQTLLLLNIAYLENADYYFHPSDGEASA